MKGTLYSADFAIHGDGNLKLLEFNTDTAISNTNLLDHAPLVSIIEDNNIDTLEIVYKQFQEKLAIWVSSSLASTVSTITTHEEEVFSIYPVNIDDADNKFILRLCYDENALFDSTYCKRKLNVHKLMLENGDSYASPHEGVDYNCTPEIYHSSSDFGEITTLLSCSNVYMSHRPHYVHKPAFERTDIMTFGHTGEMGISNYWTASYVPAKEHLDTEDYFLERYYFDQESEGFTCADQMDITDTIVSGGAPSFAESIRSVGILYSSGSAIHNCYLGEMQSKSLLTFASVDEVYGENGFISSSMAENNLVHTFPLKYFFHNSTNFFKIEGYGDRAEGGLIEGTFLRMQDDSYKDIAQIAVSESIDSYYISGSRLDSGEGDPNWFYSGSEFPSGSYLTSSMVISNNEFPLDYNTAYEMQLGSGDSIFFYNKEFLTYDSSSNVMSFKKIEAIEPGTDYIPTANNDLIDITAINGIIFDATSSLKVYNTDVEQVDTLIISASSDLAGVGIVAHNPRFFFGFGCFISGTEIQLANGDIKSIENVQPGDNVMTYNLEKQTKEAGAVKEIQKLQANKIFKVVLSNGETTEVTEDHPYYVPGIGFQKVKDLKPEQKVLNFDNDEIKIKEIIEEEKEVIVYNLLSVEPNNNYYANNILVHNKF